MEYITVDKLSKILFVRFFPHNVPTGRRRIEVGDRIRNIFYGVLSQKPSRITGTTRGLHNTSFSPYCILYVSIHALHTRFYQEYTREKHSPETLGPVTSRAHLTHHTPESSNDVGVFHDLAVIVAHGLDELGQPDGNVDRESLLAGTGTNKFHRIFPAASAATEEARNQQTSKGQRLKW